MATPVVHELRPRLATLSTSGAAWQRVVARVAQGVIALMCAWILWTLLGGDARLVPGSDYHAVIGAASRWLSGGPFYEPYQFAPYGVSGYGIAHAPVMYPPIMLLLFVPFTVLPVVLWWAIPAAMAAWALYRLRPAWWAWPIMAACLLFPRTVETLQNGNPAMWLFAAGMAGALYRWPWALVACKPTLVPFALLGARDRRWWLAAGVLMALALPFGAMWFDYLRVSANLQAPSWFLWHDWPLLAIPLVASRPLGRLHLQDVRVAGRRLDAVGEQDRAGG
jgi:hypothetical protein